MCPTSDITQAYYSRIEQHTKFTCIGRYRALEYFSWRVEMVVVNFNTDHSLNKYLKA